VYAVGDGGEILHYDGNTWSLMSSPTSIWLWGLWGSPNASVFVVADEGMILHGLRGASVVVTPDTHTFTTLGSTFQLAAEARDAGDNPVAGVTFTWSSSDEAVVTVDSAGLVTAVSNGVATITATAPGGAAGSAEITVSSSDGDGD